MFSGIKELKGRLPVSTGIIKSKAYTSAQHARMICSVPKPSLMPAQAGQVSGHRSLPKIFSQEVVAIISEEKSVAPGARDISGMFSMMVRNLLAFGIAWIQWPFSLYELRSNDDKT